MITIWMEHKKLGYPTPKEVNVTADHEIGLEICLRTIKQTEPQRSIRTSTNYFVLMASQIRLTI